MCQAWILTTALKYYSTQSLSEEKKAQKVPPQRQMQVQAGLQSFLLSEIREVSCHTNGIWLKLTRWPREVEGELAEMSIPGAKAR